MHSRDECAWVHQLLRLPKSIVVPRMHQVEASIDIDADRLFRLSRCVRRRKWGRVRNFLLVLTFDGVFDPTLSLYQLVYTERFKQGIIVPRIQSIFSVCWPVRSAIFTGKLGALHSRLPPC